jgi:hypothetical protein
MDGMLGLAPDDPMNGPSFIATLYNQGIISSKIFGLLITQASVSSSTITMGGYDSSVMSTNYV